MARLQPKVFRTDPAAHVVYQQLYAEYTRLHDYFGRGENNVMKTLKSIRDAAIGRQPGLDALVGLEAKAADVSVAGERRL
jgi:L-ribulokinase